MCNIFMLDKYYLFKMLKNININNNNKDILDTRKGLSLLIYNL
jgi:hypothetical protein